MNQISIDFNNFSETVLKNRDNDQVIEQLRDLINDKYITTQPVSHHLDFKTYSNPFVAHLKKKVRHEFRRVYDTDQINIIIQNLLELYHLLWNQNITGFMIYSLLVAILQDEPTDTIRSIIPDYLSTSIPLNYNQFIERHSEQDLNKIIEYHDEYTERVIETLIPIRLLRDDDMPRIDVEGLNVLSTIWYRIRNIPVVPLKSIRRSITWELISRGWPIGLIVEYVENDLEY